MRRLLTGLAAATAATAVTLIAAAPHALAYPNEMSTAQISATTVAAGSPVTVTVQNTTPGPLTMQIFSAPVTIGTGTVSGTTFSGSVTGTVPAGYAGVHTIEVTGAGGEIFDFTITVTPVFSDGDESVPPNLASTGGPVVLTATVGLIVLLVGGSLTLAARSRRRGATG